VFRTQPRKASGSLDILMRISSAAQLAAVGSWLVVRRAQNSRPTVLEQCASDNLEQPTHAHAPADHLIGQPEATELLGRNELRQLAQRITGRLSPKPADHRETAAYVDIVLRRSRSHQRYFFSGRSLK